MQFVHTYTHTHRGHEEVKTQPTGDLKIQQIKQKHTTILFCICVCVL